MSTWPDRPEPPATTDMVAYVAALPDVDGETARKLATTGTIITIDRPAASLPDAASAEANGLDVRLTNVHKAEIATRIAGIPGAPDHRPIRAMSLARVTMPGIGAPKPDAPENPGPDDIEWTFRNRLVWAVQLADVPSRSHGGPFGPDVEPMPEGVSDFMIYIDPATDQYLRAENVTEDVPDTKSPPPGTKPGEKY